jgi:cytochrome c oxidase assembly protein subunit 15
VELVPASISIAKAWIEYINRLVGVVLGILIIATLFVAHRRVAKRADIVPPLWWAFILVLVEGALGGIVVRLKLDPRLVSVHLFGGLALALLLVYVTMNSARAEPFEDRPEPWSKARTIFHRFTWTLLAIVLCNEIVGALVRGTIEKVAQPRADLPRGKWIDAVGFLYVAHRELALFTLVLVICGVFFAGKLKEADSARVVKAATVSALLAFAQIAAGIALAYRALPPPAQVIHVTCGILLVGSLFRQGVLTRRLA